MIQEQTWTANFTDAAVGHVEVVNVSAQAWHGRAYAEMMAFCWADKAARRSDSRSIVRCLTQALNWLAIAETYP